MTGDSNNSNTALKSNYNDLREGRTDATEEDHSRKNYLKWHDFFMATAFLAAQRSKDPCTQVGACIANPDNKIVGTGYNGMPNGCNDNKFPWGKTGSPYDQKFMYVCHAEMNAVLNKNSYDLKNCRMYVGLFPCNECAKIIIQSGIKEIIYLSDKNAHKIETKASKRMFDASGVKYWQYIPENTRIVIDFSENLFKIKDESQSSEVPDSSTDKL